MPWTIKAEGYSGWTNYETWAAALWIDNDQGTYEMIGEWADEALAGEGSGRDPENVLADQIKDMIEEGAPELEASMYSDMLNSALSEINYYEIAEGKIEEAKERKGEDEPEKEEETEEEKPKEEPAEEPAA